MCVLCSNYVLTPREADSRVFSGPDLGCPLPWRQL